jgi:phosphorylcholine metabolism protein LicD
MDISIFAKDRKKMHEVVMPEIKKLNYRTYSRYHATEDDVLKKDDFRTFKVRNYRWKFFKGHVKLDIFVMYEYDGFFYWREFGKRHKIPTTLLQEFDTIVFNDKPYTKPKDHDSFLTYHYGDWRVPNKSYDPEVDGLKTLDKE